MSNSGVNSGFAKCFILFMAVVILLQGAAYLGISIWGITLRECSQEATDVSSNPFKFAMDLVYFLDKQCGDPSVTIAGAPESVTLNVDWNSSEPVGNRTFIFMICYAAISGLWIITSLTVIATICGTVTKTVYALCFWPWFLVIIAGSILDAVATGYHVHDILHTTSVEKTFEYLSISTSEIVMDILRNFSAYFITPAVVMTCISSRVVLVWFLNIFGSSFCLSLSNVLSKRNSSAQSSVNSLATTSTAPVTRPQEQPTRQEIQPAQQQQPQQQYIAPIQQQEPNLIRPKPLQIQNITSVQRQSSVPPQQNRPYEVQSPVIPVSNLYPSAPSPNESPATSEVPTYRNTETHPDRLNYPSQQQQSPRPLSPYQQELSPISPLNNRYSTANDSFQFQVPNQRVSEELRGQLPWSYTSMPPPIPKKPQLQVYPEIPTPDYGH